MPSHGNEPPGEPWGQLPVAPPLRTEAVEQRARELLAALNDEEKVGVLSGDVPIAHGLLPMMRRYNETPIVAGAIPRLGIPGIRFTDGPRGVVMHRSTAFPISMARGATFDPELEARVGDAIGVEARTQGANLFAGVCVNLLRHPAWGRAQETYGEDSYLLGEMGAALVRGVQRHVMACVKHFACNSIEHARFRVDVQIAEADLRDIYPPHFRRCVDAGAAAVMTAYNRVNGEWCGHHRHLLTEILKNEWGFDGFVMSDFVLGIRDAVAAVRAGLDLEMPFHWRAARLPAAVRDGRLPHERVGDAVLRLLRQQVRFAGCGEPERYRREDVSGDAHRALAREVAVRSIVLLRNEIAAGDANPVLPLEPARVHRVALIGRLASLPNTGDRGSSWVRAPHVTTVLEGMQAAVRERSVDLLVSACDDVAPAVKAAAAADVAVVVAGYTFRDEGEWVFLYGGDRGDLRLRPQHEQLIEAVAAACPRTVVCLLGGSAIVTESWREQVAATLMAWYPGMEGGHAIADVLFGAAEPGGRLPCTWPRSAAQLPYFHRRARSISYGPLHGYRLMEAAHRSPAYWFGHGRGYTTFAWGEPAVATSEDGRLEVAVEVHNTGGRAGDEVVQCYLPVALGTHPTPLRTLCGFRRVRVEAGEAHTVRVALDPALTARAATPAVWVGGSAGTARAVLWPGRDGSGSASS